MSIVALDVRQYGTRLLEDMRNVLILIVKTTRKDEVLQAQKLNKADNFNPIASTPCDTFVIQF